MISYGVKELAAKIGEPGPWIITGEFLLDQGGARLYDADGQSAVLADPQACAALSKALPPGEYLGEALLQAWVRQGVAGLEIHGVYWVLLGDADTPPSRWGPRIKVRPVPPEYDYGHRALNPAG